MILRFTLPYRTQLGQRLVVCGSLPALGQWAPVAALPLHYDQNSGHWSRELELPANELAGATYKYLLLDERDGGRHWEWGPNRVLPTAAPTVARLVLADWWRAPARPENELFTAAFTEALFRRPTPAAPAAVAAAGPAVRFQLTAPRVAPGQQLCVLGSDEALGAWDAARAVVLSDADYPTWMAEAALATPAAETRYKYGLWDPAAGRLVALEEGDDRLLPAETDPQTLRVLADNQYRYPTAWRGAGVALPVFSLRSHRGLGVGEFPDLKLLVDWAVETGLQLVQVLPINDTVATHTWVDSYPYAAISVFALHPQYLNIDTLAEYADGSPEPFLDATIDDEYEQTRQRLNALDFVDYEAVVEAKLYFAHVRYQEMGGSMGLFKKADFLKFNAENSWWLLPYAVFCALREEFGTADFHQWPAEYRQPGDLSGYTELDEHGQLAHQRGETIGFYLFLQFHLDKQLREAVAYARERGVVVKGDLPIGIYRHSVDAWTQPELYHLHQQAGAPPDDFSTTGQNWRFPTYNWEQMALDGYQWWQQRMSHLARYFDALRIDHILGFFRIWEIPAHSVEGLLGHFSPALPFSQQEIEQRLGWFDYGRLCEPYIRWPVVQEVFGGQAQVVFDEFMEADEHGSIRLQEFVRTQRQMEAVINAKLEADPAQADYYRWLRTSLFGLANEVLFVPDDQQPGYYHPRITLTLSRSFRELDAAIRPRLEALYNDFFYQRHEGFWRGQGLTKLPPVRWATNMLICGEDLGMVPASVPGVMRDLGILGLHIQRMPADPTTEFGHPDRAPYLSVVSPGSHDMSTLRGWWEEDRAQTQRFFETILGHWPEAAPQFCEPWVVGEILAQHLHSPAMWAIFPLQDLVALSGKLRRQDPQAEQINVPSNPTHFWQYRFHLPLEELAGKAGFNDELRELMERSGRQRVN